MCKGYISISLRALACLVLALTSLASAQQEPGTIITYAGGGPNNVPAVDANLAYPQGLAVDSAGNTYIAAYNQFRIFKVDPAGQLTVFAGTGGSPISLVGLEGRPAIGSHFGRPSGVALDTAGNVFIADFGFSSILRVDAATGVMTRVAGSGCSSLLGEGGLAIYSCIGDPSAVAVDRNGNLFISDQANHRIRRVDAATGILTTVAGSSNRDWGIPGGFGGDGGLATNASLSAPFGVAIDAAGNLLIADTVNGRIRRVDAVTGMITTIAGTGPAPYGQPSFGGDDGPATSGRFDFPIAVALDGSGNILVSDFRNNRVRRIDPSGILSTFAGNGQGTFAGDGDLATKASLYYPWRIALDRADNLFIADLANFRVRRVDALSGIITTVAGDGTDG